MPRLLNSLPVFSPTLDSMRTLYVPSASVPTRRRRGHPRPSSEEAAGYDGSQWADWRALNCSTEPVRAVTSRKSGLVRWILRAARLRHGKSRH